MFMEGIDYPTPASPNMEKKDNVLVSKYEPQTPLQDKPLFSVNKDESTE